MPPISEPIEKNIDAIQSARQSSDDKRRWDQKISMAFANFFGTTLALYLHLLIFIAWSVYAFGELRGDLTSAHLDLVSLLLSAEAIFLAIFVLINQRHTSLVERRNADLNLQINLLTEHKITQMAHLLDQLSQRMGVDAKEREKMNSAKLESEATEILGHLEKTEADQQN